MTGDSANRHSSAIMHFLCLCKGPIYADKLSVASQKRADTSNKAVALCCDLSDLEISAHL